MSRQSILRASTTSGRIATPNVGSRSTGPSAAPTIGGFYGGLRDDTGKISEYSAKDDQCPICKTERYFNQKMRLLVSTCYHKMCDSCIERLYSLGPAPCPICGKTLRKMGFMTQTFEDLAVEKDVFIRRRIAKEFNKRRENFSSDKEYNDYLEDVEDITFNLINEVDVEKTEARIAAHREENAALIELNIQREERDVMAAQEEEERERQEKLERAKEIRREEELERAERAKESQRILEELARGKDAKQVVAQSREATAKREAKRLAERNAAIMATMASTNKRRGEALIPDPPHKPLADDWYDYGDKYVLRRDYDDAVSELVRGDMERLALAGGYRVEDAWNRAVRYAVAGLETTPLVGLPS
ncbi:hypothetical protein M408DRAFT_326806 [Serendipita vermifera MAFF 305830]|uniref:RNA polymerase II transcription factor B subunit 3 n=1 Tax=Serendipita vermifera MAFF 305830 TaxID=933852 RepID=A0A0C3BJA4_SERVB|nr:hypothetical protein M408DRAFT_326806 [Serendipita vermifera MAFF 305830]